MSAPQPWGRLLDSILNQGTYIVVSRFGTQEEILSKTRSSVLEGVEFLRGSDARQLLESRGLQALHEVLPAAQIGPLRDFVMPRIRPELLDLAYSIGRNLLGIEGEFFVDDYTILRINYPWLVALEAPQSAENPGIGRAAETTRRESRSNQVIDRVYDPKGFHNHEPPPAWAHGPHQDTWTGHSRLGVNLWWAVDDVPEECSMVFYPETFGRHFEPDPRSLYLRAGQALPKPTRMALRRGEMLIFNPEMLHGTHLNTTGVTRLALSTRLNPRQPKFNASCFYAREFWHSSANIAKGQFDKVIRFRRLENLEAEAPNEVLELPRQVPIIALDLIPGTEWHEVCGSQRILPGEKLLVRINRDGGDILLTRGDRQLHAMRSRCPHLDVSLTDGYHDDKNIWCPAHAVAFSLADGNSSCPSLTLQKYAVREEDGTIWLQLNTAEAAKASNVDGRRSPVILPAKSRPRLTVNILTRDSEERLAGLLLQASDFADEVLVGVDAASSDGTLDIATAYSDVVYQFRHSGRLAGARMLPFQYASGNWILSLDDDESMEATFDALLPALLSDSRVTHYWFARKGIVNFDPCKYLSVPPWFPDWQLRLFRNDRSLVWKPPNAHSGYRVQGPGYFETRTSILHFEPIWCSPEARAIKREIYRQAGGINPTEIYTSETRTSSATLRQPTLSHKRPVPAVVDATVHDPVVPRFPPWHSTIQNVEMPRTASPGESLIAEVTAVNTGILAWTTSTGYWPVLQLGCHFLRSDGTPLQMDVTRSPMPRFVAPGESVTFYCKLEAPLTAGCYLVEWDLVSELECWFAECGSKVLRTSLEVA